MSMWLFTWSDMFGPKSNRKGPLTLSSHTVKVNSGVPQVFPFHLLHLTNIRYILPDAAGINYVNAGN